jgi:hypothetical protein
MTMSSSIRLVLPRSYILHDNLKLYTNNSVFKTAFKQFCALYFTIAIEIKDIMEANNYHMAMQH